MTVGCSAATQSAASGGKCSQAMGQFQGVGGNSEDDSRLAAISCELQNGRHAEKRLGEGEICPARAEAQGVQHLDDVSRHASDHFSQWRDLSRHPKPTLPLLA